MEFTKDIHFSDSLKEGEIVTITYSGALYKNASNAITIVYGFGQNWEYTTEQNMQKVENGFSAAIEMKNNFDTFHFCFRNENYEWDNNGNVNYNLDIQSKNETTVLELLDNLLDENINLTSSEDSNKQQILEDILSENEEKKASISTKEPILVEDFDMNQLIEDILNPVIHCEAFEAADTVENESQKIESLFEDLSSLKNEIEIQASLSEKEEINEFDFSTLEIASYEDFKGTELITTPSTEQKYLVSPRRLNQFYLIRKKIKLALYKLMVTIPKLLSGEVEQSKD